MHWTPAASLLNLAEEMAGMSLEVRRNYTVLPVVQVEISTESMPICLLNSPKLAQDKITPYPLLLLLTEARGRCLLG